MRNITLLGLCTLSSFILCNCNKEEAKEKENADDSTTVLVYEGKVDDIPKDLDTAYMYLLAKTGSNFSRPSSFLISNFMTDDAICGGNDENDVIEWQDISKFNYKTTNSSISGLWLKYFAGIQYLNMILYNKELESYPQKTQVIAEADFLRAYFQFEMLKYFGNLPMLDKYIPLQDTNSVKQNTLKASFNSIVADLEVASKDLPSKASLDANNIFRPSKGAALALLGKVYLYMASPYYNLGSEYYTKAKNCFEQVINSGEYKLVENYGDQFVKAGEFGSESIFEINYILMPVWDWQNQLVNTGNPDPIFIGVRGISNSTILQGWGFVAPVVELNNLFLKENDTKRKSATLIDCDELIKKGAKIQKAKTYTGYYSNKNTLRADEWDKSQMYNSETNDRIIRYADVLLMYAEACLKTGATDNALNSINQVRNRAGVSLLTSVNMDDIIKERRLELALEGHRFFDIVRWGIASEYLQAKGFVVGKSEFMPIPEIVLKRYKNMLQNPGY